MTGDMGVRINSSVSAAKASAQQAASKKDGQPAAGADTDFSHVLAKAQPKKKADATPTSDKPVPAAAKAAGKKPVKSKAKDEQTEDAQPATPADAATKRAEATDDSDDTIPVEDVDSDTAPVAATDDGDDSDGDTSADDDTSSILSSQQPAVVSSDPARLVAQATATPPTPPTPSPDATPVPPSTSVQRPGESVSPGARPAKAVKASPVESLPSAVKVAPAAENARKSTEVPAEHDVAEAKPAAAHEEIKVAVQPVNQAQDDQSPAEGEQDGPEVRAQAKPDALKVATAAGPVAQFNELFEAATDRVSADGAEKSAEKTTSPIDAALTAATTNTPAPKTAEAKPAQPPAPPATPDVRFAEDNHPKVVTAVKSQLLPGGGSIQLRLDPPDLGPLRLEVRMEDGSMSASFVTASDQATSLLTHTLGQLKHALEGAGISVDKLQVRQGSADQFADSADQRQQQGGTSDQSSARQEQQRREMLNRMWQKVAGGDPLDLVA